MLQPTGKQVLNELVTTKISELAIVAEKRRVVFHKLPKPFKDAQELLEGDKYVTISLLLI
jgi:hypothetical protein